MKKTFKKTISLIMTVMMIMTCWVFIPGGNDAQALLGTYYGKPEINGAHFNSGTTNAYGMPVFDGNLDRWFKWQNGDDWTTIYYPSHIYLDKTESLQSAGYYMNVQWHFGNGASYRILLGAGVWGDNNQWTGHPERYYTMNNIFPNYAVDASCTDGYYTLGDGGLYNGGSNYDLRIIGYNYNSQGSDGFNQNGIRHNKYVLFRSRQSTNNATIYLKGSPSANYVGQTKEYNTSGGSLASYGLAQQYGNNNTWSTHSNGTAQFNSKGADSSYKEGQWIEMAWNVTIYDKESLNNAVNKAATLYNNVSGYGAYLVSGNISTLSSQRSSASSLLTTRKTNQTAIDDQTASLTNAANALSFAADNTALVNAINAAKAIKNQSDYTVKYTAATRQALETALRNATDNTSYDTGVTTYSIDFSDSGSWSAGQRAATDQNNINALTKALTDVNMQLERYTVTFNFANSNSDSDTYDYGTIITVPDNSAKAPDAKYHYSYRWPADVSTEVLGNATYDEIETATAHDWNDWNETMAPSCESEGAKQRDCKECGYIEVSTVAPTDHKPLPAVEQNRNEPTCTVNGSYDLVVYCDDCGEEVDRETVVLEAPGHKVVTDPAIPVTCTTDGKTEGSHCSVCNEVFVAQQTIFSEGHKEEIIPAVNVTCTVDGKTEGVRCSVCKEILTAQETITAPGHAWTKTYISDGHGMNATHYQVCDTCGEESERVAHTWNDGVVQKPATCTTDGQMLYTCTANGCGGQYIGKITAPGHNYGEWIDEEKATCLEGGTRGHYQCSECNKYFDQDKIEITDLEIGALNHDIKKHAAKAATCTEDGWDAYETCSRCDYTTYSPIGNLGHDEIEHAAKAPTCTKIGWDAYVTCSRCDYTTYEEKDSLGHDKIAHEAQAPTCTEGGWEAYETCSRCDYTTFKSIGKLGHIEVKHDAKTPTCTEIGWDAYVTCERENCNYTTYKEKEALDHDIVIDKAVEPTCTDTGLTEGSHCTRCNDATVAQTVVKELGHDEISHEAKAPSCTEVGWDAYVTCSRCDYTTKKEIASSGHAYVDHAAKAPTCTEIGWDAYQTCENCNYTTYTEKTALDHDYIDHDGKAATCLVDGWKAYQTCSRCDYTTYEAITAPGHSIVKVDAKAPACEDIGWDAYEYCTACDYTTYNELAAPGHSIVKVDAKTPTCTEIGWDAYEYCTVCDYTTYNELPANGGHDLVSVDAKAVTCTEIGWDAYEYCKNCDYTTKVEIPAPGHAYVDHEGKAPTCTEDGWEAYKTCENCDYTSYKPIGAFDHAIASIPAQAPACEAVGWEAYEKCLRCDYTTYVEIPSTGHSIKQYEAKAPACEEAGWEAYEACDNCDYTTKVEIPALSHSIKQYGAQAPTCAEAGHYAYEACDNCDYTTKVEIPALEHEYVDHEGKAATCSTEGWKPYQTCKNCDYTSYEAIPTLDHNIVKHEAKAPTCTEIGWEAYETCTMCDYTTYKELPKVDHADENKDGICDDCTVNIGCKHSNVVITVTESTCLTYGKVTETCGDCGTFISEEFIAPTGHHDHDGDGECDGCSIVFGTPSCSCICHKSSGIMRLIYSILRTFWRLFKITKTCPCGAVHY